LKDQIRLLIQLQHCDDKIRVITLKKEEAPSRVQRLENELGLVEVRLKEEQEKLDQMKKDRRKIDQEIQDLESKIEKSATKLSNIKSNKEYGAVLKEIEDLKNTKFQIEDKAIQAMEQVEAMENGYLELKNSHPEWKKKFQHDKRTIEREISEMDRELEGLQEKRSGLVRGIDQDLLRKYLFLRDRKGGQAVSGVVGGVCQSCHLGIPPQQFNEVIRGNELLACPHCHRIIYWGEDEHFQIALDEVQ
jgi:predicted  nucleic acid-binding Zn-ribbon protein